MDEIEKRLRETSETCFNCYEAWDKDKKKPEARESLLESIHELRKVASRLEIEVAISERNQATQKPIPIPSHRDSKRRAQGDDADGNSAGGNKKSGGGKKPPSKAKKPPAKKASGGQD